MIEYASPDCPEGYDTVWSFLSREEPFSIELLLDPARDLLPDQEKAQRVAQRAGFDIVPVKAPPALSASGQDECFAFPLAVLYIIFH